MSIGAELGQCYDNEVSRRHFLFPRPIHNCADNHIHDVLVQLCVPPLVVGQLICGIISQLTPQTSPVLAILTNRFQVRT